MDDVRITTTWRNSHTVEPPDDMSAEDFAALLSKGDEWAWDHALGQTDSSTAELVDWWLS